MVDRIARDKYAELLRHFAAGLMTNREYEDRYAAIVRFTNDEALRAAFWCVWFTYDDLHEHRMTGRHRLGRPARREMAKIVLFLNTRTEYQWPASRGHALMQVCFLALAGFALYWSADLRWYGLPLLIESIIAIAITDYAWRRTWKRSGDDDAWPFLHASELNEARRHPRSLSGR